MNTCPQCGRSVREFQRHWHRSRSPWHGSAPDLTELWRIISLVARASDVPVELLVSRRRPHRVAWPRQIIFWLARAAGYSTPVLGAALGGRDHTTVMYGSRVAAGRFAPRTPASVLAELEGQS